MSESAHPEAAFLASITAGVTHEVRNVLAIIKESAGLVEDLVQACGDSGALDQEKLSRATQRIELQVKRGAQILTNLNRLSHMFDREVDTLDLNEEVEFVVALAQRAARQSGRTIQAERGDLEASLRTNPLLFQMALFAAVECGLNMVPKGGSVVLRSGDHHGLPSVEIAGACEPPAKLEEVRGAEGWEKVVRLFGDLNTRAEPTSTGFRIVFERYS
jgi:hypothetical protein